MTATELNATFLVRLTEEERDALRAQADAEHRSMQEVARAAILERVAAASQRERALHTLSRVMERDAELLDRLSR